MPEESLHISQAKHNKETAKNILKNNYPFHDWAITCSFYAALHFFEANLYRSCATHSEQEAAYYNITPHTYRNNFIMRNHSLIYSKWKELYSASLIARYLTDISKPAFKYFSINDASELLKKMELIRHHFGYLH